MKVLFKFHQLYLFLSLLLIGLAACKSTPVPPSEYTPYIQAYTGGVVSAASHIRIELTKDMPLVDLSNALEENPFRFSPSISGKTYWIDNHTLEFVPDDNALQSGQVYKTIFRLGDFVEVDKRLEKFSFDFQVQERACQITAQPLLITSGEPKMASVEGLLTFSDVMDIESVRQAFRIDVPKDVHLHAILSEAGASGSFRFRIDSIPLQDEPYMLELMLDASRLGLADESRINVEIPQQDSFTLLSAQRLTGAENGLVIAFSSPLDSDQHLKGLIEVSEIPSATYLIKGNQVYAYFEDGIHDNITLKIHEGLKDYRHQALGKSQSLSFEAQYLKPQVEMVASSAILPDSKQLLIPFRAVSLHAVDVSVIRIYENNILSFLQNNTLSSASELKRSGQMVYKGTMWLGKDASKNLHRWEDYFIDLSKLIQQEPGAIYRVLLSFRQEYSAYPCEDSPNRNLSYSRKNDLVPTDDGNNLLTAEDREQWERPDIYFYNYSGVEMDWKVYDWKQRNNPCHPSYYMLSERTSACNVFASNIGMIVKSNNLNGLWINVTNLLTTEPVQGADVTVYNYQLQPVGQAKSDAQGFVKMTPKRIPFIAVAEYKGQKTYVRIVEGEEQSVSRFDTGGKQVQKGLKGYIYGERGVWRPGDTLHICFVMEDKEKRIPDKHPVSLELYNPHGQFYTKVVSTQGVNGFYTFHLPTKADVPTGIWNAYVKVGGTAFHKPLRIETIKPNRLKVNLSTASSVIRASQKQLSATLTSSWLTGAQASGLKTKVELSLSKVKTQFKDYPQYTFNNPASDFSTIKANAVEGKLDTYGKERLSIPLPKASQAPGMLNATLVTRVFEPGGDASLHSQTIPYSPFKAYVGINLHQSEGQYLETDKEYAFDIVTLTDEGKRTDCSHLEYKIYKIDWSWWWENRNDSRSLGSYINNSSIVPVKQGMLQTVDGKSSIRFQVNYPDWGRYLVYVKDKEGGHATGGFIYMDWPEGRGRASRNDPEHIKMLSFALDKDCYEVGETATAMIPTAADGRALISIEDGTHILKQEWIKVSSKQDTPYSFRITSDMAPNVYLHVTLLQPHAQTVNDLPIRIYGIKPVFVTDKQTVLQPKIDMPDVLRPETSFQVNVSEKSGKPMTYTLAIVDEGLLDLTGFKTPDLWAEFYAREALGIRTWDMYDHVLGAYVGQFGSIFRTGGDEALRPAEAKANRFNPVVAFMGPFQLDKKGKNTHRITLPAYVGSVRTMVVAGQDGAYGKAERTSQVRTPLMLLSTLPRVLSVQEEIEVPVNVFALEKGTKEVNVSIQVSGADVQVLGSHRQRLTFAEPGDSLVCFRLKTGRQMGKATVSLTAEGGGRRTHETIELEVRNPNPVVTLRSSQWIAAGEKGDCIYRLQRGTEKQSTVTLEVSRIPSVDLSRRLDFIDNYPHQCTEQITSKALSLLFAGLFKEWGEEEKRVKTAIQESINQLYGRQLPNGGFAYWPGDAMADEWTTSYVGLFLTLAQERGYAVQRRVLDDWRHYQQVASQNWRRPQDREKSWAVQAERQQAFRLFALTACSLPEIGAMNRLKEHGELDKQARWNLAAAFARIGKQQIAEELTFGISRQGAVYSGTDDTYGSSLRDEAIILETLLLMNHTDEAMKQAVRVSNALKEENSFNTQSTAFALMALGQLAEQLSGVTEFSWTWNEQKQPDVQTGKAVYTTSISQPGGQGTVTIHNQGEGALYADLITRTQLINDTLPAQNHNLNIRVAYTYPNGQPLNVASIPQGTDFCAVVTVTNPVVGRDCKHLALTHILPGGWEVFNQRMYGGTSAAEERNYAYQDIRDDRVLTYFSLKRGETKRFVIRLQATYAGRFTLPSVQCEDMYDTSVLARTKAGYTVVVR